jgi:hypothetical protein
MVPALDLLFTRDSCLPVWMRFKPHQDHRLGALCVGGASARRMVVDALGEIVCETDVVGTVDAEEHVGTPTHRKNKRSALRLASLAQGKISSSEILVRPSGFEPPRYCYRQPLKLVRLPVPPRPHKSEEHYSSCERQLSQEQRGSRHAGFRAASPPSPSSSS